MPHDLPVPNTPDDEGDTSRTPRRMNPRLLWVTVGAAAAVAVAGAAVAVPLLRPAGTPTTTPSTAPSEAPATPSAAPTPTPTPAPTCTVTTRDVVWSDPWDLRLPADGPSAADRVQRITRADVDFRPTPHPFFVDDETFAILTANDLRSRSSLTVAGRDGEERWTVEIDGRIDLLSSPATTGVPDVVVVAVTGFDGGEHRMMSFDIATGELVAERETGETSAVTMRAGRAWWSDAAPREADSFYVSDRDALSRVDAATLEPQWTVAGADYGVEWFEGGVPFDVNGDVAFIGSHAVDAATGGSLGWESAGTVVSAAGATLQTRLMYDHIGPYDLSGLDTALGESCWTREVLSYAATADTLWILTPDGAIERIDPLTGEARETVAQSAADTLTMAGRYLLAHENDPDDYTAPSTVTVFDGGVERGRMTVESGAMVYASDTQLVVHAQAGRGRLPSLTGFDEPGGDPVWRIEEIDLAVDAGIVLRADVDGDENIVDYVLRH